MVNLQQIQSAMIKNEKFTDAELTSAQSTVTYKVLGDTIVVNFVSSKGYFIVDEDQKEALEYDDMFDAVAELFLSKWVDRQN